MGALRVQQGCAGAPLPKRTAWVTAVLWFLGRSKSITDLGKSESCKLAAQRILSPTLGLVQKWTRHTPHAFS
jgi:hypothetical protein